MAGLLWEDGMYSLESLQAMGWIPLPADHPRYLPPGLRVRYLGSMPPWDDIHAGDEGVVVSCMGHAEDSGTLYGYYVHFPHVHHNDPYPLWHTEIEPLD